MIPLINHDFQWGRSEVVIIYPDYNMLNLISTIDHWPRWTSLATAEVVTSRLVECCTERRRATRREEGRSGWTVCGDFQYGKPNARNHADFGLTIKGWWRLSLNGRFLSISPLTPDVDGHSTKPQAGCGGFVPPSFSAHSTIYHDEPRIPCKRFFLLVHIV